MSFEDSLKYGLLGTVITFMGLRWA